MAGKSLESSLHEACQRGRTATARQLLQQGAAVDGTNDNGWTALHKACRAGHKDVIQLLHSRGADIDKKKNDGYTPLHLTCLNGHKDATLLLLNLGAAVNETNGAGKTPYELAKEEGETAVVELLESKMAGSEMEASLREACSNGDESKARQLLDQGAAVDGADDEGLTPLHKACDDGHQNMATLVLERGAAVDRPNNNGWTPLHFACRDGNQGVIQLLLSHDAGINEAKDDGYTPLHLACLNRHKDAVQLLLNQGADMDKKNNDGKTPLDLAKQKDETAVIELLESWTAKESGGLAQRLRQQLSQKEEQLVEKDRRLRELSQQLASKEQQLASKEQQLADKARESAGMREFCSEGLLWHPPVRAHVRRDCMVCMEAMPIGSIVCKQKGCELVMCQGCAGEMCAARIRSSGSEGSSNGELVCTHCTPSHSISPATLARTVPLPVFKGLQAKLSREPALGSWRAFMARNCPNCKNTAAVATGLPFYMCTSVECSSKHNLFCVFCNAPWKNGHLCAAPIDIKTVEDMLAVEAAATDDSQLQNVLVRPCPRCPVRICTKDPDACYHMTCAVCDLQYCGICHYIKNDGGWWSDEHKCVENEDIYMRSEARRKAVLSAYQEALA